MHKPLLANRLSRWLAVLLLLVSSTTAWSQSTANYAFTTSSTGSLVDMSTGTTDALATGTYRDDVASAVQNIGFTFVFMGTPYTQFSVNSNGQLRLGATAISGSNATPTSGTALLGAFGGDNAMQATGRVAYKVVPGTNRTLVVEWTGLRVPYAGDPAAGTPTQVQIVLEENTGKIEYRYGSAYNNSTTVTRAIFISSGTSAGQIGVVKTFNATPTYDATVTSATTTSLVDNAAIAGLNSTADGARTVYSFVPPSGTPLTPSVTTSAVTQTSLNLAITDNSTNEGYFTISRSTDNVTFTTLGTVLTTAVVGTGGTFIFAQTGLAVNTTYYYRVTANNEAGGVSGNSTVTISTLVATPICGTKAVGPSAGADYPTLTAAFTALANNGLCGPLVLELQAAYVSTTETFPLVYNYSGATATNTVTVRPAAGATGLSITGTGATAVMSIAGGKYLIIDGRPGGSGATVSGAAQATDLTISSTSTSGIPLQFTSDATFNTVQHVQVKGVGTSDSGSPDVNFTGTVTTTGNSDNTLQYCNIGDGATTPVTLIYGGNALNARNSILNNNLFNNYGTGSTYGLYINQSGTGWTITGNSLYQTANRASVSGTMYGIFINANNGHTISGNFIGGSAPSLGGTPLTITGTAAAYRYIGISLATTTGTATNVQGNAVGNITWVSSSGATTGNGILAGIYISSGDVNVGTTTGNTIGGATAPISVSTTTTGGYSFGISSASSGAINISGNTISNISGVGAVAVASNVAGILASTGSPTISRNKIYNLSGGSATAGTAASLSTGIWLTGGTTTTVTNNLIGDLRAATSASLVAVSGIAISGGTTHNIYYNTINLSATSTGATFGTSGIYLNSTSATLDARNNIVVNKSTAVGTGGYTVALRRVSGTAGTAPANLASTANNNLYYAGTPSATNLIYVEGTTTATNAQQTLLAYRALVATRESNSVTEDVPFLSTTGTAATFLHINPAVATQVEGNAAPIASVTTDFDGDARSTTAPDLGADEGTFTPQDLSGPSISYTALGSTSNIVSRTLVATITDFSGVATGANAPRLYYRKGTTGAYVFVNATSVSGSQYTFTFDYSLIGGVAGSDVVQYYVSAQDVLGNISTSPLGGSGATPPGTAAPTVPNQFLIQSILAGTYYVGTSTSPDPTRTYATLTAAVAAYNLNALGGVVTFVLLDATYSTAETFPININANADASAANTLTIKPNTGVTSLITGSVVTGAVLKLNGADYVTIDGSNAAAGTSQDLTIENASATGTGNAVLWIASASTTDGANFNTVKNTVIRGNSATGFPQFTVFVGGGGAGVTAPTTSTPVANSNNTLANNTIYKGFYGVFVYGSSATVLDQNNSLVGNQIGQNVTANGFSLEGIRAVNQQNLLVQGNEIQNIVSAAAASHFGLNLGTLKTSTITRNSIHNVQSNSATSGNVGYGISLASAAFNTSANASANTISNNVIYNISAPLAATGSNPNVLGIANGGGYGDKLYFNTVLLNAAQTAGAGYSAAISNGDAQFSTATSALDVRNNIIAITANVTTAAKYFGFYTSAANVTGSTLNYNDYYLNGSGAATFAVGNLNGTSLASSATLAAWRTATGQEANSVSVNPNFAQVTTVPFDLTPTAATLNNLGDASTGVTVDFTGATRGAAPDMGAYEFTPAPIDIAVTTLATPITTGCYSATEVVTVTINNNATVPLNFALNPTVVTVVVTLPGGTTQSFTTTINTGTLAPNTTQNVVFPGTLNMTAGGTYSFAITSVTGGDGTPGNDNLTVTRTVVGVATQPQLVTFTGFTGSNLSTVFPGWSEATGATVPTGTTSAWTSTTFPANNTTAKINLYTTGKNDWIVSPKFLATNSTVLTFDAGLTDYASNAADPAGMTGTDDFVEVRISTDCGQTFVRIPAFAQFNAANQPSNGSLTNYSINLSSYAGQQIILGFFASEGTVDDTPDYDFHLDNLSLSSPLPIDLTPVALLTPTATQGCYSAAETVSVSVRNIGTLPIDFAVNPATVTVVVTTPGGPQSLTTTLNTGTLAPNALQTVTVAPTLNMSAVGTYSFVISATVTGDQVTSNDVLAAVTRTVAAPVAGTVTPGASSLCVSGTASLTLTGAANGSIQWQQSTDNTTFTDISGATSATYTTAVLNSTTYFRAQVRCATQAAATSNVSTITVNNPLVATTNTPPTICSGSTATLTATASTGANIRFFSVATGGTALTSTTPGSFTTPALTANTTYYAEAFTGGQENVGKASTTGADGTNASGGLYFTTTGALTIANVTVYRTANAAAGTATIYLLPGSTTTTTGALATVTVTVPANTSASVSPTVLTLNFAVPAAGQYTLYMGASSPSLIRDTSGNTFPYTSPSGAVSITDGTLAGYYYFFYNWQIGTECSSAARTAIQVNVTPAATATFPAATANTCGTSAYQLGGTVGGSATAGTYTSSGTGTFSPNATTLNATYTPSAADLAAGTVTITLTSTAVGTCPTATATLALTIGATPVATFSYATTSACAGSAPLLTPTLGTGATAGAFTSTTGLTINATTGAVNPATSTAGTYTVTNTIAASGSCAAATATATVTINALPATPTYTYTYPTRSTVLFTSSVAPAGTTYQWYLGTGPITGATGQTYTANGAVAPGSYTVRFINTATGCQSAASTPLTVTATNQALAGSSLTLFPNPTADGQLTLQLNGYTKAVQLTVIDALGRVVLTQKVAAGQAQTQLDLSGSASGVYTLRAVTEGGADVRRIVRE